MSVFNDRDARSKLSASNKGGLIAYCHQPKKSDGMTALHIAAASNDVHLVDFIMKNVEN